MSKFNDDHFLHQFDKYPEDKRFGALAKHAALLLNRIEEENKEEEETLIKIRDALMDGVPPAKIALAIQGRLLSKFETHDLPEIDDLQEKAG